MQQAQFINTLTLVCPTCRKDSQCKVYQLFKPNNWAVEWVNNPTLADKKWTAVETSLCNACGMGIKATLEFYRGHFSHLVEPDSTEFSQDIVTLVVLPPQKEPVYFLINEKGYHFRHTDVPGADLDRTFQIDENSCPTNWFGNFERIQIGDDADPHGMIRFIRAMTRDDFDQIEKTVRKEFGMEKMGGTTTDLDKAVFERAFPEVADRFLPE